MPFFQCVGPERSEFKGQLLFTVLLQSSVKAGTKLIHEDPEIEVTIFYIDSDLGKYAGEVFQEALNKGVKLCQGIPGEIMVSDNELEVIVEVQGMNRKETFDRVILSIGQRPIRLNH